MTDKVNDKSKLKEVKKITGVRRIKDLTSKKVRRIQNVAAKGKLTPEQLAALIQAVPHFVEMVRHSIAGIEKIAPEVKESQKAAYEAVVESLRTIDNALADLAKRMESDEARLKMATLIIEAARIRLEFFQELNRSHTSVWKHLGNAAVLGVTVVGALFLGGKIRR